MRFLGLLILIFLPLSPLQVGATLVSTEFHGANHFYEKGDYTQAIIHYKQLLDNASNRISPALYFNLGNAYFKNKQVGFAIANYRRADALSPRDPDIHANLRFARDSIATTYQEPPWHRPLTWFRLNEITVVVVMFWWLLILLLTLKVLLPSTSPRTANGPANQVSFLSRFRVRPMWIALTLVLFLCSTLFLVLSWRYQQQRTAVFVRDTTVRFGPLEESQSAFSARDGLEMPILVQRDGWVQVSDGSRQGWVSARDIFIVP